MASRFNGWEGKDGLGPSAVEAASHRSRCPLTAIALLTGACALTAQGSASGVSGRVLGPDGGPVAGASVHQYRFCMNDPSASGVRATVVSRVDGSFEIGDVAFDHVEGGYDTLVAVRQGYGFACWQSHSWKQTRMPPVLKLTEKAILRGVVVDERANVVAAAVVSVLYVRYRRDVRSLRFSVDFERRAPIPQLTSRTDAREGNGGGLISVRRRVAAEYRFDDEFFCGYVVGEDRDFSFRIALDLPVFMAENITVLHDPRPGGRPNRFMLGRMIVSSTLHTAHRCGDRGAGAFVLLCYQFAGTFLLHAVWGLVRRQKSNLLYAAGIAVEVFSRLGKRIASTIWG